EEKRLTSLAHRQEAEIKRLSLLAEVMRRQTEKRAKQAKSIFTRVERMKAVRVVAPRRERKVKINFPEPPHSGRIALHASGLAKGYGGPLVFSDVSFEVERRERLLVMGLNGAGKTSLLRIVAGRHNVLLLDEPTNNLDPPSRTGVARALAEWPGTMVIVSHDPEFVDALRPGRVMFMPEGRIDYWEEDLLDVVSMA